MGKIVVGKNILESLTAGMYTDAKIIFREYVQNSVDSIDKAVLRGLIKKEDAQIVIDLDKNNNCIKIEDNGTGILSKDAVKELLDIGNSNKSVIRNRGFRGIGRLVGLTYCDELVFETSYKGENEKTIIKFDCRKLNKFLVPGNYIEYDLIGVINEITEITLLDEDSFMHYFKVTLNNVINIDNILDFDIVKEYLGQVLPVPFNKEFMWGKEINEKLKIVDKCNNEYNIYLSNNDNKEKIFKYYSNKFISNMRKQLLDNIKNIEIEFIKNQNEELIAAFWYSVSDFKGSIHDEKIKGIRLRKGNIQIGDKNTLNSIFKEERFNGWFQGEIYIFDSNIIPNARRDDFEKNEAYENLLMELKRIGYRLSKKIRKASNVRNSYLNEAESMIKNLQGDILNGGFNSQQEKKEILEKIHKSKEEIAGIKEADFDSFNKLFRRLDFLSNKVEEYDKFKINRLDNANKLEKKVLNKVFDIVTDKYPRETANEIIECIINQY